MEGLEGENRKALKWKSGKLKHGEGLAGEF